MSANMRRRVGAGPLTHYEAFEISSPCRDAREGARASRRSRGAEPTTSPNPAKNLGRVLVDRKRPQPFGDATFNPKRDLPPAVGRVFEWAALGRSSGRPDVAGGRTCHPERLRFRRKWARLGGALSDKRPLRPTRDQCRVRQRCLVLE